MRICTYTHIRRKIKYFTVPEAEGRPDLDSPWFVFNDFVVRNISEEEALHFPGKWKVRELAISTRHWFLMYLAGSCCYLHGTSRSKQSKLRSQQIIKWNRSFNSEPWYVYISVRFLPKFSAVLTWYYSSCRNRDKNLVKHKCLRSDELPRPGTLVAIDAEFVQMQQVHISKYNFIRNYTHIVYNDRRKQSIVQMAPKRFYGLHGSVLHAYPCCGVMVPFKVYLL